MYKIKKIDGENAFQVYQQIKALDFDFNETDNLLYVGKYTIENIIEEKLKYNEMINSLDNILNEIYKI